MDGCPGGRATSGIVPSHESRHRHSPPRERKNDHEAHARTRLRRRDSRDHGAAPAAAFCGFFVAKADTKLFNKASQVVLVRDGDRTVITMSNDFRATRRSSRQVPVPTFIQREQIHVGDRAVLEHLDAYTAPRLVEYQDPDPCQMTAYDRMEMKAGQVPHAASVAGMARAQSLA
ncbi:MAG: DUF2330 domain-containing protein [bacterium]